MVYLTFYLFKAINIFIIEALNENQTVNISIPSYDIILR